MTSESLPRSNPFWMRVVGWILTILPALLLLMSATFKLMQAQPVMEGFTKLHIADLAVAIGLIELLCTVLYLIPQTSVLGAILLAGYLGGAILSHLQDGPRALAISPFVIGVVLWLGLWFRDPRVRALAPFRK